MKAESKNILAQLRKLSIAEREAILAQLAIELDPADDKFIEETKSQSGITCPFCGGHECLKKNGRTGNRQRYMCKTTGKTFSTTTGNVLYHSHKKLGVWKKFISCMMNKFSLRKCSEECCINLKTAFAWRHKILDSLRVMMGDVRMNGIVEADEAFFRVSFSGNHKKSKSGFVLPRKAHKRGGEVTKRGISGEQVCVPCAINRKGLSVARAACLGRPSKKAIVNALGGHILSGSSLCTDGSTAYNALIAESGLEHVPVGKARTLRGQYGIQHINSYHSHLKTFMKRFYGVTTKHLDNYLVFYNFVQHAKGSTLDKVRILLEHMIGVSGYTRCEDISARPALPFAA